MRPCTPSVTTSGAAATLVVTSGGPPPGPRPPSDRNASVSDGCTTTSIARNARRHVTAISAEDHPVLQPVLAHHGLNGRAIAGAEQQYLEIGNLARQLARRREQVHVAFVRKKRATQPTTNADSNPSSARTRARSASVAPSDSNSKP